MATAFPPLRPISRSYDPGQFPLKRFNSMNGAGVTRLYGNVPFDATLRLQFIVNDQQLESITTCYQPPGAVTTIWCSLMTFSVE